MNKKIENLLKQAEGITKHDWEMYEFFKAQIARWSKDDEEYHEAVRRLVNILEV